MPKVILNDAVLSARDRLMEELTRAAVESGLTRVEAEARLSSFMCSLWNLTEERIVKRLPPSPRGYSPDRW